MAKPQASEPMAPQRRRPNVATPSRRWLVAVWAWRGFEAYGAAEGRNIDLSIGIALTQENEMNSELQKKPY